MNKGAFQVSRTIFENDVWTDVVKFRLFFYILGKATFSENGIKHAGIHLERGQYLRSLRSLQDDLAYREGRGNAEKKYPLTTIQRKIKSLEKEGRITTKSTEYGTLFTVVNYALYQGLGNYKNDSVEQQWNSDGTVTEQRWNNNKKEKKEKNDNKHIHDLFDHYCSKNIVNHQKLSEPMKRAINARLKDYSFDELKKAIDNYAIVFSSDEYWFTHKYPLADFMRDKDIRKFVEEADPLSNFKKDKNNNDFRQKHDPRDKEIAFQRWIQDGNDPDDFDWSD